MNVRDWRKPCRKGLCPDTPLPVCNAREKYLSPLAPAHLSCRQPCSIPASSIAAPMTEQGAVADNACRGGARPISGLPEIGFLMCASRVNPTCDEALGPPSVDQRAPKRRILAQDSAVARGGRPSIARHGRLASVLAPPPALHPSIPEGEGKQGDGPPGRPKTKNPGSAALALRKNPDGAAARLLSLRRADRFGIQLANAL